MKRSANFFEITATAILFAIAISPNSIQAEETNNGLAPEVTDLNAADVSYALEHRLPYLKKPFLSVAPRDRKDGIPVGKLGRDGGNKDLILNFAHEIAEASENEKTGKTDSLLISYRGKLIFESYYRRGRANYPHYQMSITKSYTAMGVGRAIQLGHLSMEDLEKPVVGLLQDLSADKLVKGAEKITLHEALHMSSGIRLNQEKVKLLRKSPAKLKGQGQIQAYLQHSDPIPPAPRKFKYQASDPALAMQVIAAVVPGNAQDFIRNELLGRMGISNYGWQAALSGLPKSAAGSSFRSRDMLKMGMLVLDQGKWQGKQLIPAAYIKRATSPIRLSYGKSSYGYFWWVEDFEVGNKTYHGIQGRGAGGQFIHMFPDLDLIAVVTAHNKGMGTLLRTLPQKLIPAFVGN
jgi:CubicO group peptidase (beta-lactamase class C family)